MSAPFSPDLLLSSIPGSFHLPLAALAGVVFDRLFGEVRRWHPLVGFGALANAIVRALNRVGYQGPLSIEWEDSGMDREFGATESCAYCKRVDFPSWNIVFVAQFDIAKQS